MKNTFDDKNKKKLLIGNWKSDDSLGFYIYTFSDDTTFKRTYYPNHKFDKILYFLNSTDEIFGNWEIKNDFLDLPIKRIGGKSFLPTSTVINATVSILANVLNTNWGEKIDFINENEILLGNTTLKRI